MNIYTGSERGYKEYELIVMHVRVYACKCACAYIICACTHMCTSLHAYVSKHAYVCKYARVCKCIHLCVSHSL